MANRQWTEPMKWANQGVAPSENLSTTGFKGGDKPPAGVFNHFLNKTQTCVDELQTAVDSESARIDTINSEVRSIAKGGTGATTAAQALTNLGLTATAAELNKMDGVTATTAELNYVDGVTSNIQTQLNGKAASDHTHNYAASDHTHNYAGSSSVGGSATSAVKLDSSAGSATQPIYFSNGKPTACTHSLNATVPADAKFTDTTYSFSASNPTLAWGTTSTIGTAGGATYKVTMPANPNSDTKVTSVGNHYTPTADTNSALSVDASSSTKATWGSTNLVTGVNLQRDAAGHVTGLTVDSIKMPDNPDTDNDENVRQGYSTVNNSYPLLFSGTAGITSTSSRGVGNVLLNNALYVNPYYGRLYAKTLYEDGTDLSSKYAAKSHTHSEYATADHTHNYAAANHTHDLATNYNDGLLSSANYKKLSLMNVGAGTNAAIFNNGTSNTAAGNYSFAKNYGTKANGVYSDAAGYYTTAGDYQCTIGRCNSNSLGPTSASDTSGNLFIIGNGVSTSVRANAFRVTTAGKAYGQSSYGTSGADYAEMWEWQDGNVNDEDRRGYFVTVDENNLIRKATTGDFILGVTSATPAVVGDVHSEIWHEMYLKDVFGEKIIETVEVEATTDEETGEIIPAHTEKRWKLNPEYDPTKPYVSRDERKEWQAVGLMGKLVVIDDGTCVPGGYCDVAENGTATGSMTGWRVLERLDETHVKILYR